MVYLGWDLIFKLEQGFPPGSVVNEIVDLVQNLEPATNADLATVDIIVHPSAACSAPSNF
jgi:hypothetical protein